MKTLRGEKGGRAAAEMVQWLRAYSSLTEDRDLVPSYRGIGCVPIS